ncbi:alpha/beta hydrolase family protein [Hymenobacter segetis]|uniref:Alpha/beta hydrolase family protein n=1 Tax=Hymenobacter segetis TaxID=2025509 RepID=A0ABU9M0K0_9BACT
MTTIITLPPTMLPFRLLLLACLLLTATAARAARVDTLAIPSAAMHKTYRAAVVLPASYAKNKKANYPVLYLLHGAWGHFSDWLNKTPDKQLLHRLADQYNLIIVNPEGETFSFYLNSPVSPDSQFETYLTQEIIQKIDQTYRTVADRKGRVIAGLSMGGHGALYLSARHPDLYCAAGSMSGALDLTSLNRKLSPADAAQRAKLWTPILGSETDNPERFAANSVISLVDQMHRNALPLIFDCGVDDGLIDINRELHRRLVYSHIPHDYTERPGAHTWEYWQTALPYQVLFLTNVLQANGTTVPH